ncbi:MAG TPA: 3-phosphoshikimate 1-carboxyvinyltransferase [bacterium]
MDVTIAPAEKLGGSIRVPGDKSISHRAAMMGAIAAGTTSIANFLWADDCRSTLSCLRALGVNVVERGGALIIKGEGPRLRPAPVVLDAGNSGTTVRLLAGLLAGQPFATEVTGDESLRARPMDRVAVPLRLMGAAVETSNTSGLPMRVHGGALRGITYTPPVASAQVKSAVLLAGLYADGETTVIEPVPTRDHTERMLEFFGAGVTRHNAHISVQRSTLRGRPTTVPGDISSAAFILTAAAAVPGSEVTVTGVGINPTRTGVLDVLREMGAEVAVRRDDEWAGEPVGTVTVRGRGLHGVAIGGEMIPRVIDELPVLCVAATTASGTTEITDAAELRVKEADRIGSIAAALRDLSAEVEERADGLTIYGSRLKGGRVDSHGDHRLAMAFAVAGLLAAAPVTVARAEAVAVSFPGFFETVEAIRR